MKRWVLLAMALAAAGCAATTPRPATVGPGDAQAEVRGKLGVPAMERKLASGATAWYYVTGPSGFDTWRVVFDRTGAVADYQQVLTAGNFAKFAQGATRDELLDLLGPPIERMRFARSNTEAWTYRWMDGTLEMIADAVFDGGGLLHIALYRDPAFSSTPSGDGGGER